MSVTYLKQHTVLRHIYMEECYLCEAPIALPSGLYTEAKQSGHDFYCPFGHSQVYKEPEVKRLVRELEESQRVANRYSQAFQEEKSANVRLEQEKVRLTKEALNREKRAKAGVCPECHRTFSQLSRHMVSKHKVKAP